MRGGVRDRDALVPSQERDADRLVLCFWWLDLYALGPNVHLASMILAHWSAASHVRRKCKLRGKGLPAYILTSHPPDSAMAHQLV